jgi:hypothetical protein
MLTTQRYAHYDEHNVSWPEQLAQPLFPEPLELSICPSECKPEVAPRARSNGITYTYPPSHQRDLDGRHIGLPACSESEPVYGSYLPVHELDRLFPPARLPSSSPAGIPVAGRHRFVTHSCRWMHAGLRFGMHIDKCLVEEKRVLVLGDSHGRVIADALSHRLTGQPGILTISVGRSILRCEIH